MKIRVITRDDGEIVGTIRGDSGRDKSRGYKEIQGEIVPLPGQRMQEIDVPDDVGGIADPDQLHRRIRTYLPKHE